MSGLLRPAAGFEAGVGEFFAEQFQRHAVLQRDGDGAGEAVHQAADRRTFLGHGDEDFARLAIGIEADGDVALVSADVELVRDRRALFLQLVTDRARRSVEILFLNMLLGGDRGRGIALLAQRSRSAGRAQRLRLLASIAIDRDRLQPQLPGLDVALHDVFDGGILRQVHCLRNRAGDKRLRRRHHLQMPHVVDRPRPLRRLERAIKHRKMLVLDMRSAFDGAGSVDVGDNLVGFFVTYPKLEQRRRDGVVDDLNHPAAHQLLVLDQRQIRLDAGSIAIHHETYCACWS